METLTVILCRLAYACGYMYTQIRLARGTLWLKHKLFGYPS